MAQVQELELNDNLQSVDNLLTFLEKIFNGGSDFKCALRQPAFYIFFEIDVYTPAALCDACLRAVVRNLSDAQALPNEPRSHTPQAFCEHGILQGPCCDSPASAKLPCMPDIGYMFCSCLSCAVCMCAASLSSGAWPASQTRSGPTATSCW